MTDDKQVICENIPIGSLITLKCGCLIERVESKQWNYPSWRLVQCCQPPDGHPCTVQIEWKPITMIRWEFFWRFKDLNMVESFDVTNEEAEGWRRPE